MSSECLIGHLIERLRNVADLQTECQAVDFSLFEEAYARFLATYPGLVKFKDYLAFLRLSGGAFVDAQEYSLVIYGFGGYVATSFEEHRLFLDRGRYFHFADFVRSAEVNTIHVLAFDLQSDSDVVYVAEDGIWVYEGFANSFCDMLKRFAGGAE